MYDMIEKFNTLRQKSLLTVLGIESSCDETAAAVVRDGREILSNVIASQIPVHRRFGGVVPEIASRNHTMAVDNVIDEALVKAGLSLSDVDAVGVTYGAGLAGALLVGVTAAKALAYSAGIPLIKVNHIEAHIAANYTAFPSLKPPFLALVASGGHTSIIDVSDYNDFVLMGSTKDDAIGEAFDKTARLLGLPYPGGPEVDRLSKEGKNNISFFHGKKPVNKDFSLSYSGLKTAVVNYIHNARQRGEQIVIEDVCCSLTHTAVDMLADTVVQAALSAHRDLIVLAGGVASNSYLRETLSVRGREKGINVLFPPPVLCTDNAVMVAARAYFSIREGKDLADLTLNACPGLKAGRPLC